MSLTWKADANWVSSKRVVVFSLDKDSSLPHYIFSFYVVLENNPTLTHPPVSFPNFRRMQINCLHKYVADGFLHIIHFKCYSSKVLNLRLRFIRFSRFRTYIRTNRVFVLWTLSLSKFYRCSSSVELPSEVVQVNTKLHKGLNIQIWQTVQLT